MFEDIVGTKFEGVDVGTRDIISEVKVQLTKGFNFGVEELEVEAEAEVIEAVEELAAYQDENLDTLAQMYMDEFSAEEIITMLDFEMTPLAEKKIRFQIRMHQFVADGFMKKMMEDEFKDDEDDKDHFPLVKQGHEIFNYLGGDKTHGHGVENQFHIK